MDYRGFASDLSRKTQNSANHFGLNNGASKFKSRKVVVNRGKEITETLISTESTEGCSRIPAAASPAQIQLRAEQQHAAALEGLDAVCQAQDPGARRLRQGPEDAGAL